VCALLPPHTRVRVGPAGRVISLDGLAAGVALLALRKGPRRPGGNQGRRNPTRRYRAARKRRAAGIVTGPGDACRPAQARLPVGRPRRGDAPFPGQARPRRGEDGPGLSLGSSRSCGYPPRGDESRTAQNPASTGQMGSSTESRGIRLVESGAEPLGRAPPSRSTRSRSRLRRCQGQGELRQTLPTFMSRTGRRRPTVAHCQGAGSASSAPPHQHR
jgi:hypothetical protein